MARAVSQSPWSHCPSSTSGLSMAGDPAQNIRRGAVAAALSASDVNEGSGMLERMVIVRSGSWVYAGQQTMPVDIIGLRYDFWFELARANGEGPDEMDAHALSADGVLYFVRFRHAGETTEPTWPDSSGYSTVAAAMRAAEARAPSPIDWT